MVGYTIVQFWGNFSSTAKPYETEDKKGAAERVRGKPERKKKKSKNKN